MSQQRSEIPLNLRRSPDGQRLLAMSFELAEDKAAEFMMLEYTSDQVEEWLILEGYLTDGVTAERIFTHFTPPKPKTKKGKKA